MVIHKENGGVSSARNVGLKAAKGEFIGWVDSDDWITLDMFEYMLKGSIKYKTPIMMCGRLNVSKEKKWAGTFVNDDILSAGKALELMLKYIIRTYLWDKLFERHLFDDVVFPEGSVYEDAKIVCKIIENAQWIGVVHHLGCYHNYVPESITHIKSLKNKVERVDAALERSEKLWEHWPRLRPLLIKTVYEAADEAMYMLADLPENEWTPYKQSVSNMAEFLKKNRIFADHPDISDVIDINEYDFLTQGTKKGLQQGVAYSERKNKKLAFNKKKAIFKQQVKSYLSKDYLRKVLTGVLYRFDPTYRSLIRLEGAVEKISRNRSIEKIPTDTRAENLFWLTNSKAGETIQETKQRVFLEMPKWGGQIGVIQNGNNNLLKAFKKVCNENNLDYWMLGGTLLGAVRHKGFIPWDDDIDVGMMRDQLERLFEIIENNPAYDLRWYYHSKGPWRTAKFTFNDASHFWIDILCYDYAGNPDFTEEELWTEITRLRKNVVSDLKIDAQKLKMNYQDEPPFDNMDEKRLSNAYMKWIPLLPHISERNYIYRSLDNVCAATQKLFPIEKTMPFVEMEFEGEMYSAPCDYEYWLNAKFGDYYSFPKDIGHIHTRFLESGKRTIINS